MSAPVPRVASSIDDLRVGQILACRVGDAPLAWSVCQYTKEWAQEEPVWNFAGGRVVILRDPPPEPVTVSREAFDRLAQAVKEHDDFGSIHEKHLMMEAARALVDEVEAPA